MRRARLLSQDRLQLSDIDRVLSIRLLPTMPPTNWPRSRHAARAADPSVPAEPSAPVVVAGR
jgi:hypothetical protein